MRVLFYLVMAVLVVAVVGPATCRRTREHVLLTLVRESERPVEVGAEDPLTFRFPPTAVRAVAVIDYHDAVSADGHVSFIPPDGSARWMFAAGVCGTWAPQCLDAIPPRTVDHLTWGEVPAGLHRIEPADGAARTLENGRLYALALFGHQLFALKTFYRDERGIHLLDGARFATAVVENRRGELRDFLDAH
jgi:hypothetical protein